MLLGIEKIGMNLKKPPRDLRPMGRRFLFDILGALEPGEKYVLEKLVWMNAMRYRNIRTYLRKEYGNCVKIVLESAYTWTIQKQLDAPALFEKGDGFIEMDEEALDLRKAWVPCRIGDVWYTIGKWVMEKYVVDKIKKDGTVAYFRCVDEKCALIRVPIKNGHIEAGVPIFEGGNPCYQEIPALHRLYYRYKNMSLLDALEENYKRLFNSLRHNGQSVFTTEIIEMLFRSATEISQKSVYQKWELPSLKIQRRKLKKIMSKPSMP